MYPTRDSHVRYRGRVQRMYLAHVHSGYLRVLGLSFENKGHSSDRPRPFTGDDNSESNGVKLRTDKVTVHVYQCLEPKRRSAGAKIDRHEDTGDPMLGL